MNYQKYTEPAGGTMTSSSQAGSRNCANHTALQGKGSEKKMNATCGRACLEQYEKLSQSTWWGRMFGELLVGTGDWYSTRCKLTWKLKVTPSSRAYFQLAVSMLPIDENEFGLLPTATASDYKMRGPNSKQQGLPEAARAGLLPTPTTQKNDTSRSDIVGDWTENIIERELAQSEFSGHGFTADTDDQRSSAGSGSFSETDGEIPQRNKNAEPRNASSGDAADTESKRSERLSCGKEEEYSVNGSLGSNGDVTDTERKRLSLRNGEPSRGKTQSESERQSSVHSWQDFPTQPPICGGDDGLSRELDGITFPKWRSESIKAYGNAIVPAVAFEIFKVINEIDNFLNENSYLL